MSRWSKMFIPSKTSPKNGRKGCLCRDRDAYSIECCNGDIIAQGIGSISGITPESFLAQENGDLILQENNSKIIP
ncbi:hypothetical protein N9609_00935 [bacterium]|nr:hypothetical protein [bacterium]